MPVKMVGVVLVRYEYRRRFDVHYLSGVGNNIIIVIFFIVIIVNVIVGSAVFRTIVPSIFDLIVVIRTNEADQRFIMFCARYLR